MIKKLPLSFLLIEDDEIERLKFKRVFNKLEYKHSIIEAKNGEEALKVIKEKSQLPNIILLDLNMPKMNGLEFLKMLKSDNLTNHIPVIILTTSNNHHDLLESYKLGIAGYFVKALHYKKYETQIEALVTYWENNELIN